MNFASFCVVCLGESLNENLKQKKNVQNNQFGLYKRRKERLTFAMYF